MNPKDAILIKSKNGKRGRLLNVITSTRVYLGIEMTVRNERINGKDSKKKDEFDIWYLELIKIAKNQFNYEIVPCQSAWEDHYNEGFDPYDALYDDAYNGV